MQLVSTVKPPSKSSSQRQPLLPPTNANQPPKPPPPPPPPPPPAHTAFHECTSRSKELKLMLRGAELSGAIEEEEQLTRQAVVFSLQPEYCVQKMIFQSAIDLHKTMDMIENVLEIKDTHVREVMTPLVDVVAIDTSATLVDFHELWGTHQYSRVRVYEQCVGNIVGIAYAMVMLDYVRKGDVLESTPVADMAHKPAFFVPDSMSVWNLLGEFCIRKVHMAIVLNEYSGTVGVCANLGSQLI